MTEFTEDDIQPSADSMLTDDPKSALLFAQACLAFAKDNREEFVKKINSLGGRIHFTDDAFIDDFLTVFTYLEMISQVSDKLFEGALYMQITLGGQDELSP